MRCAAAALWRLRLVHAGRRSNGFQDERQGEAICLLSGTLAKVGERSGALGGARGHAWPFGSGPVGLAPASMHWLEGIGHPLGLLPLPGGPGSGMWVFGKGGHCGLAASV